MEKILKMTFNLNKSFALLLLLLFLFCSKEKENESLLVEYNTKELEGEWRVEPSSNMKFVFTSEGKTILINNGRKSELYVMSDKLGLRFHYNKEEQVPFAYFLFSEKKKNVWGGIMEDDVIRIVRKVKMSESILE